MLICVIAYGDQEINPKPTRKVREKSSCKKFACLYNLIIFFRLISKQNRSIFRIFPKIYLETNCFERKLFIAVDVLMNIILNFYSSDRAFIGFLTP